MCHGSALATVLRFHAICSSSSALRVLAGVGTFGAGVAFSSFYTARATEKQSTQVLLAASYAVFLFCVAVTLVAELALTVSVQKSRVNPLTYGRLLTHLAYSTRPVPSFMHELAQMLNG